MVLGAFVGTNKSIIKKMHGEYKVIETSIYIFHTTKSVWLSGVSTL
jgi:hypothetical protein